MDQRIKNILMGIGLVGGALILWYFKHIVGYIVLAGVIGIIGRPVVRLLTGIPIGKRRISSSIAALITLLLFWTLFVGLFSFLIPLLASEAKELSNINYQAIFEYIEKPLIHYNILPDLKNAEPGASNLNEILREQFISFIKRGKVTDVFESLASTIGNFFMLFFSVSFISFFFLREESMFSDGILLFIPIKYEQRVRKVLGSIFYLLKRYFIGILLEVLGVMLLDTIGFTIIGLGFSHAVVVALFAGIMNVIPYIGPWIGGVFGIVVALATNLEANFMEHTLPLLGGVVIVVLIVQLIDNILFQPLIYSSSVRAHPLEIFLVILMAGYIGGLIWMILAIPSYTIVRVIAHEFFNQFKFVQRITSGMD